MGILSANPMNIFSSAFRPSRYLSVGRGLRSFIAGAWWRGGYADRPIVALGRLSRGARGEGSRTHSYAPRRVALPRDHINVRPPATGRSGGVRGSSATKWGAEKRKRARRGL